jgi:hypothetical protein
VGRIPPELGERDGKVQSIPSKDQPDGPVVHLVTAPKNANDPRSG